MKISTIYKKNKPLFLIGLSLSVLPIITYYLFVFYYAINIPFYDEYFCSLGWVDLLKQKDFPDNVLLLFGQANDHRIFTYYLSIALQYLIFDELNYRNLILFGNLGMIGLLYVLFILNDNFKRNLLLFVPVILILFVPIHEISDWGMLTISGINQYLLVFASLSLLKKKGNSSFIFAVLLAAIATFSFGSGMFTFIVGFIVLYFHEQRSWKRISMWAAFMLIFITLFFVNYVYHFESTYKLAILDDPFRSIKYFLTFFGRIFIPFVGRHLFLLTIVGLIITSLFLYLLWNKRKQLNQYSLAFSYLIFMQLSILAATLSRSVYGVYGSLAPRYELRSVLFIVVLYIIALGNIRKFKMKYVYLILGVSFILYFARIDYNSKTLSLHRTKMVNGLVSFYIDTAEAKLLAQNLELGSKLLTAAINKGNYVPPTISELYSDIHLLNISEEIKHPDNIMIYIDVMIENSSLIKISGWAFLKEANRKHQKIGIVLISDTNKIVFSTIPVIREGVINHFKNQYHDIPVDCGFNFILDRKPLNIQSGKYEVGVCIYNETQIQSLGYSNRYIEF